MGEITSLLVAIASYGRKQDHYLEQLIAEYRKLRIQCRIVVLSDAEKPVHGAEILVGLPSSNPYSLPFAHRRLFVENVDEYDLFIYTEDDTLLTAKHIEAFLRLQQYLADDEILGFIRSEVTPSGQRYITSINGPFRWLPERIETRGEEIFAGLSNSHSGCYIATQQQLRRAIASGGFMVEPHDEPYDMLVSAAIDIYRQCGLRRLLCLSRIHEFIVPHLPNKYFNKMGVEIEELDRQICALRDVQERKAWQGKLFEPETRVYDLRWSKNLYEKPDDMILQELPSKLGRLLSVGVGSGQLERILLKAGVDVHAVALDAVFAGTLRANGINAVEGTFEKCLKLLDYKQFDTILITDVLHLVQEPVEWLRALHHRLCQGGQLIARVENTGEIPYWVKDFRRGCIRRRFPDYKSSGVQPVSALRLRRWCIASGLHPIEIKPIISNQRRSKLGVFSTRAVELLTAQRLLLKATKG